MKKINILILAVLCLIMVGCSNDSDNKISTSTETDPMLETPVEGSLQYEDLHSDELSEDRGHMEFEEEIFEEEIFEEELSEEELLEEEFLEEEFLEEEFLEEEFLEEEFLEEEFIEDEFVEEEDED